MNDGVPTKGDYGETAKAWGVGGEPGGTGNSELVGCHDDTEHDLAPHARLYMFFKAGGKLMLSVRAVTVRPIVMGA